MKLFLCIVILIAFTQVDRMQTPRLPSGSYDILFMIKSYIVYLHWENEFPVGKLNLLPHVCIMKQTKLSHRWAFSFDTQNNGYDVQCTFNNAHKHSILHITIEFELWQLQTEQHIYDVIALSRHSSNSINGQHAMQMFEWTIRRKFFATFLHRQCFYTVLNDIPNRSVSFCSYFCLLFADTQPV